MSKLLCNVLKISGGQMPPLVARLLDPILIVLLKLMIFRQKSGGKGPPEIKVGGPRPMRPPGADTYGWIHKPYTIEIAGGEHLPWPV